MVKAVFAQLLVKRQVMLQVLRQLRRLAAKLREAERVHAGIRDRRARA
jgi:hypothetical protein